MRLWTCTESRCLYPTLAAIAVLATLLLFGIHPVLAQEPDVKDVLQHEEAQEEKPAATEQATKGPVDEFDRGNPRSSFQGLAEAAREGDFERAAEYLDLRNLPKEAAGTDGPELARQLKIVLDRALWVNTDALSRDRGGLSDDGLPDYRDSLGRVELDDERVHIYIQRVPRGDGVYMSLERSERPNQDVAKAAEETVSKWRAEDELYLPSFPEEKVSELSGTLPYPPEGSAKPTKA